MKKHITFDFLRGLLVACIARDAGQLLLYFLPINFPWSAVPTEKKGIIMLATVLTIAVYSVVLLAVLLRPASTTKVVFGILSVIAVVWMGFLVPTMFGTLAGGHSGSFVGSLLIPWTGPPLTAVMALFCVLKLKHYNVA